MNRTLEKTKIELLTTEGKPFTVPVISYISAKKKAELNQIPIDFFTKKLNAFSDVQNKINALAKDLNNAEKGKQLSRDLDVDITGDVFEVIKKITAKIKEIEAENPDYHLYIHTFNDRVDIENSTASTVAKMQKSIIEELFGDELNVNILRAIIKQDTLSYEVKELINSDYSSDFWQLQDVEVIAETADYFRGFIKPRR